MSEDVTAKYQAQANQSDLGKKTDYDDHYNPHRLYPIPRAGKRLEIGINPDKPPFYGYDVWNHYEVSWLNSKGKPMVAIAEMIYDCHSPLIIESKSMKLYFNSLNNTKFATLPDVEKLIAADFAKAIDAPVTVKLTLLRDATNDIKNNFVGENIDDLDIECHDYLVTPSYLQTSEQVVEECLTSDLLKSNCLVTNQPDWGSVQIDYRGKQIDREGLLRYLVSFRNHNEFHEQCIERIFVDILNQCKPERLAVNGRYTRRGGLDINPYRSTEPETVQDNTRLVRQ